MPSIWCQERSYLKNFVQQVGTSHNSSSLFMHFMHLNLPYFTIITIIKPYHNHPIYYGNLSRWSFEGALFALTHFKILLFTTNHFPSYLFPSIINDIYIIGPLSIVSFAYEHFKTEFHVIGFFMQPLKYITWSPFIMPPNFNTPFQFITPLEGNKILGVMLDILTFISSFIKDALLKDVWHVNLLPKIDDVQITFGIVIHCFVQHPSYFLWCTLPFSTFTKSFFF